jgi:hypothetical protein
VSGFAWAAICFMDAALIMALGDLASEEIRGWLDLLPRGILHLAAMRLDPEMREAIYQEDWLPELIYALRGAESRPITRLIKGTYFALGLFISARKVEAIPSDVSIRLDGAQRDRSSPLSEVGRKLRRMNRNEMIAIVKAELETIPKGGLNQNAYRAAYEQARLNSLSTQPAMPPAPEAAHALALQVVRRDDPGFVPDLR